MERIALLIFGCLLVARVSASPLDDLRSPSQQVRDAAAALLRTSYVPPPRSRWEPVVDAVNGAGFRDLVEARLLSYGAVKDFSLSGGGSTTQAYRLDDLWLLRCSYGRANELLRAELTEGMNNVWVAPPADFTGAWTTYFVNGQRSHEIQYRNGQYFGTFTSFHSNGSKSVVQHYDGEGVVDGEDSGYFPSGALSYKARYSKGKPTGTWVWYNEDGSVRSTRENPQ